MFRVTRSATSFASSFRRPLIFAQRRGVITLAQTKYTAQATASGPGWDGTTELDNGSLKIDMAIPKELGGSREGHDPDQLLALGYASCFLGSLHLVAKDKGIQLSDDVRVKVQVLFGDAEGGGMGIQLKLTATGVDAALVHETHSVCPYSRIFKEGTQIETVVE